LLIGTEADPAYCASGLLISAEPLRLRCPASTKIIDRFTVWRNGAHAVWLGPYGASIVSDRSSRGDRPWVLGLPLAGRIPAGTIRAEAEILPPG
jgi:competence protein ComEC